MEGRIYNEPAEIGNLNEDWQRFIKARRLKMALALPAKITEFLTSLWFVACADNSENLSLFYLYPFYEESLYQYHYRVRCKDVFHEVTYYTSGNLWCVDNMRLKEYFSVSEQVEKNVGSLFGEFEPIIRLEKIRTENLRETYKKKYLHGQVTLKDVIIRDEDFYLVFEDGTQAKIISIQ